MKENKFSIVGDNKKAEDKMTFKELKEKVEIWGQKYGIETEISKHKDYLEILSKRSGDELVFTRALAIIDNNRRLAFNLIWGIFGEADISEDAKNDLFEIILPFAKTDPKNREYEKRYIIPLPGLVTTDGEKQYLTKNITFFASRRDKRLRQTWKEEHLKFVPEIYRKYAVELEEEDDR